VINLTVDVDDEYLIESRKLGVQVIYNVLSHVGWDEREWDRILAVIVSCVSMTVSPMRIISNNEIFPTIDRGSDFIVVTRIYSWRYKG
jgi:hypothetical protein